MLALLALLMAPANAAMDVGLRYVQGQSLALADSPDGETLGWLRPGTPLRLLEVRGDFARVALLERPPEHPLEGWLPAGELSAARPAPAPTTIPAVVDLARCVGGRAEWLGSAHAGGGLDDQLDAGTRERVARAAWFVDGGARPLRGSPFASPGYTEAGLDEGLAHVPATAPGLSPILVLGPCDVEGALLSTAPSAAVVPVPLSEPALELVDGMAVTIAEHPVAIVDAVAVAPDVWAARYRGQTGEESLLLTDAHGRPMEAFGPAWQPEAAAGAWGGPLLEAPRWLRMDLEGGPALLMMLSTRQGDAEVVELLLLTEGGALTRLAVTPDGWGC